MTPIGLSTTEFTTAPSLRSLLALWLVAALWLKVYRIRVTPRRIHPLLADVLESAITMSTLAIVVIFFSQAGEVETSRSFVPVFAVLSVLALIPSFYGAAILTDALQSRWPFVKRVAVMGEAEHVATLLKASHATGHANGAVVGLIVPEGETSSSLFPSGLPVLGTTKQLAEVINKERLDRIIIAGGSHFTYSEVDEYRKITGKMGVAISYPVACRVSTNATLRMTREYGMECVEQKAAAEAEDALLKRPFDIAAALLLLIVFSPVIIVLAILVKATSPGPIFYKSARVGRGGRHFTFWKFRSMYHGTRRSTIQSCNEQRGHIFKIRNDPRITSLGRYMRRHSLDELPQLFNVIRGDMSLVGPRPLPIEDLDPDGLSLEFNYWAEERARVRPGITGLWQTCGRSNLSFEQMVQLDIEYIHNYSLVRDIRIMLVTPIVMCSGRGAY